MNDTDYQTQKNKPASGEWTAKSVSKTIHESSNESGYALIAAAHNAALTAAKENSLREILDWESGYKCGKAECAVVIDQLRQQLAAEREMVQALTAVLKTIQREDENPIWTPARIAKDALAKVNQNWIRAEDNPGYNRYE